MSKRLPLEKKIDPKKIRKVAAIHLQEDHCANFDLFINTKIIDIKNKGRYFQNAIHRLKESNIIELDEQQDTATPSPGVDDSPFQ